MACGPSAIAAGAVGLAIGTALLLGRGQGRRQAEQEREAKDHEAYQGAVETRNRIEDRVRRAGDGTAADQLRDKWSRD